MPLYEYFCSNCNQKFELLRPLSMAGEEGECPCCHRKAKQTVSVFSSLTKDESGITSSLGGSSCGSCSATSCGTCGT